MSSTTVDQKNSPAATASAEDRIRKLLERVRREAEAASGWVMRKQRTSPLETTYVTR